MILWILSLHFWGKNCHRKLRICVFKKSQKTILLQNNENDEIVMFKISCSSRRADFQDKYVLMFAGMFMRVHLLFRTIPK